MSVSADRETTITFSGDLTLSITESATQNTTSPAIVNIVDLASGNNVVTVPTGGSTIPAAVTIVPPSNNTNVITLKGTSADTGLALHLTDPATITINTTVTTLVLSVTTTTSGVRLVWS